MEKVRLMFSALENNPEVGLAERIANSTTAPRNGAMNFGAAARLETYRQVCDNYDSLISASERRRGMNSAGSAYSDSASALAVTTAIDATIRAYTSSIAGYFCKEVAINQANQLVNHFDVLDVIEGEIISPNIGAIDKTLLKNTKVSLNVTPVLHNGANTTADVEALRRIIPKTVEIYLYNNTTLVGVVSDNGTELISAPGILAAATIDYETGEIGLEIPEAVTVTTAKVTFRADITADAKSDGTRNHVKGHLVGFIVMTEPELLTYEQSLIQSVAVSKALNVDMSIYLTERLQELYTVKINERVAKALSETYTGTAMSISFSGKTWDNVRSYSDYFYNQISELNERLTEKAYRVGGISAILVGKKAALSFIKMGNIGVFKKVKNPHMVGLIGFLDDDIPVIRTDDVAETEGYAVVKTADGEIAPLLRSIFLPLTTTPEVGNFDNPVQTSGGVYFQEAVDVLYSQAVYKFTVTGADSY